MPQNPFASRCRCKHITLHLHLDANTLHEKTELAGAKFRIAFGVGWFPPSLEMGLGNHLSSLGSLPRAGF